MRLRQITIEGGRYLIFYSFDDEQGLDAAPPSGARPARAGGTLDDPRDARDGQPTHETARESADEPSGEDGRRV